MLIICFVFFFVAIEGSSTTIIDSVNITDEEKLKTNHNETITCNQSDTTNRPFLETVLSALDCNENDYLALLGLCLIYALANNKGIYILVFKIYIFNESVTMK